MERVEVVITGTNVEAIVTTGTGTSTLEEKGLTFLVSTNRKGKGRIVKST